MKRCLTSGLLLVASVSLAAAADVRVLRVPNGGRVPDVVQDAQGVLHLTYGDRQSSNGYYVQSRDGGKTFSSPITLNRRADTMTVGMERGPKIALGKAGVLHVVWLGHYQRGGGAWYTRTTDGGKSFEPERQLNEPKYGLDNAAVAADAEGNVFVLWTGGFPGTQQDPESPAASPIVLVSSTDNGQTFSKNELLKSDQLAVTGRACGCCRLEAHVGPDGNLYVAFRGGYKSLRDPYVLIGPKSQNNFHCIKASDDQWHADCPMQGIPFHVDAKGRILVAWMSRQNAYWTLSGPGKTTFRSKVAAPAGTGKTAFPLALPTRDGDIYFQWQQGSRVNWAFYRPDGSRATQHGDVAANGIHKATAFEGSDGNIYLVD